MRAAVAAAAVEEEEGGSEAEEGPDELQAAEDVKASEPTERPHAAIQGKWTAGEVVVVGGSRRASEWGAHVEVTMSAIRP